LLAWLLALILRLGVALVGALGFLRLALALLLLLLALLLLRAGHDDQVFHVLDDAVLNDLGVCRGRSFPGGAAGERPFGRR